MFAGDLSDALHAAELHPVDRGQNAAGGRNNEIRVKGGVGIRAARTQEGVPMVDPNTTGPDPYLFCVSTLRPTNSLQVFLDQFV